MARPKKVTIVGGAGAVGSQLGQELYRTDRYKVVLLDIEGSGVKGVAKDMAQASGYFRASKRIIGTTEPEKMKGSELVIVTAGVPRKPGQSRGDLLENNSRIIKQVGKNIKRYAPKCRVIVVTNPLDAMTYLMYRVTRFRREKVMGMGGELDSARMGYFISRKLKVPAGSVRSPVIGTHGKNMIPLPERTTVSARPFQEVAQRKNIDTKDIINKTVNAGAEIAKLREGRGSASFATATAAARMAKAILNNLKATFYASVYLNGEYGLKGLCLGVPVVLGKRGIERIVEYRLPENRQKQLEQAAQSVKKDLAKLPI